MGSRKTSSRIPPAAQMHSLIALPVAGIRLEAIDGKLLVRTAALTFEVDPATGAVSTRKAPAKPPVRELAPPSPDNPRVALSARGMRVSTRETDAGPVSVLGDKRARELASFPGLLRSIAFGEDNVFAGTVRFADDSVDVVAGRLGGTSVVRIASGAEAGYTSTAAGAACAGEDAVLVTGADPCVLHAFRACGDGLSRVTVARPDPAGRLGGVLVRDGVAWVLAGRQLAGIRLSLLRGHDVTLGATFTPVRPSSRVNAGVAKVAFAVGTTMGIDHPRLGRLVFQRASTDPVVASGDEIVLDDVVEELPGVHRVRAWHPRGTAASHAAPPPPLVVEAPRIVVRGPTTAKAAPRHPARWHRELLALAKKHGFVAPATLVALLERASEDAVFARWLAQLGCQAECALLSSEWETDPFLVSFGGVGNGDAYCLYPYPPAMHETKEPPVVEFLHETNTVELRAHSFDDFLASMLARQSKVHPDIVQLIQKKLGLTASKKQKRPAAPRWLPSPAPNFLERARALIGKGDLVRAERLLVGGMLGAITPPLRKELSRIYGRLGWTLPLESLAAPTAVVLSPRGNAKDVGQGTGNGKAFVKGESKAREKRRK